GVGLGLGGPDRRPVRVQRPASGGPASEPAVRGPRPGGASGGRGDGPAAGRGTGPARLAPGAAEGAGELAAVLVGADGVRRSPRGANGQQYGRAVRARPGGGAEELLRLGVGLERPVGGDALLAVPDLGVRGAQPTSLAGGVPDGVCGVGWPGPREARGVVAVESHGGATPGLVAGAAVRG